MPTNNEFKGVLSAGLISRMRPLLLWMVMLPLMDAAAAPAAGQLAPEVESFIQEMVQKHQFNDVSLRRLFARVEPNPAVITAISTPITALPWYEFRSRFVDAVRINGGVRFWREHAATLPGSTPAGTAIVSPARQPWDL